MKIIEKRLDGLRSKEHNTYIETNNARGNKMKILMTEIATGKTGFVFNQATSENAEKIVADMNRLNQEAARLTGKAIRFVFSIIAK